MSGYVVATLMWCVAGLVCHSEPSMTHRRDCGKSIAGLVQRDGQWLQATARIVCR
jgi:hypothetical protein